MNRLVVIGQGYMGLPMALRSAEVGLRVVGLDISPDVVRSLNAGRSQIGEVSNQDLLSGLTTVLIGRVMLTRASAVRQHLGRSSTRRP